MLIRNLILVAATAMTAFSAFASPVPSLTPDGWGKLRIGMREGDAFKQLGLRIRPDNDVDSLDCRDDEMPGYPDMYVMAERGVITRIAIDARSHLRTDRGFGIGSKEAELRRSYGKALRVETRAYADEPAHDLTFWTISGKRGIRYGTDEHGRVETIYAGSKSIQYIEGCL